MAKLPRVSSHGAVSSDLGAYKIFKCTGTGSARSCGLDMSSFDGLPLNGKQGTLADYIQVSRLPCAPLQGTGSLPRVRLLIRQPCPPPPTWTHALMRNLQGVAAYTVANAVVMVLVPLFTAIFIIFRYMCCCCRPSRCSCVRCGLAWPSKRTKCCGFREKWDGSLGYTACDRYMTMLYLICFLGFLGCVCKAAVLLRMCHARVAQPLTPRPAPLSPPAVPMLQRHGGARHCQR
jgi:hypothetical protein